MKYECKENDALIELGKDKSEVLISIQGDTSKIIIGVKDLKEAMSLFGITPLCVCDKPKHSGYWGDLWECQNCKKPSMVD